MKLFRFCIIFFFVCSSYVKAEGFPLTLNYPSNEFEVDKQNKALKPISLQLQGSTKRSILFFSIYEVALYQSGNASLLEPVSVEQNIASVPYALWLRYSRDLSKSSIESALRKGLTTNTDNRHRSEILKIFDSELLPKLRDVNEGESLRLIRFSPLKAIVKINEERAATLEGEMFLDALFAIWLGDESVISREELFQNSN